MRVLGFIVTFVEKYREMKHNSIIWRLGMLILCVLAVTSCSKTSDLLSTVPASSRGIALVNINALVENAGCRIEEGKLVLPQGVSVLSGFQRSLNEFAAVAKGVDLDAVVLAAHSNNDLYATLRVTDSSALEAGLEEAGFAEDGKEDGYKVYRSSGNKIFTDGNQLWFMSGSLTLSPKEILDEAGKGNVREKLTGVTAFLEQDRMIAIAASAGITGFSFGNDQWICVDINPDGNALALTQRRMTAEGELIANSSLKTLDPAALRLVPDGWEVVAAFGLQKNIDWHSLVTVGGMMGGFQMMGMLESLVPYLEAIDGTVEFAANPKSVEAWQNATLTDWNFMFAAQMPEADARKAIDALGAYLRRLMIDVKSTPAGITVSQNGLNLTAESSGGILRIVNGEAAPGAAPEFFANSCGAAKIAIPKGVVTGTSGITLTAKVGESESQITLAFPDRDMPALQTLLMELAQ